MVSMKKFMEENRLYLTWDGLAYDLSKVDDRAGLRAILEKASKLVSTKLTVFDECESVTLCRVSKQ